jgi:uncharacterized protein DUF3618
VSLTGGLLEGYGGALAIYKAPGHTGTRHRRRFAGPGAGNLLARRPAIRRGGRQEENTVAQADSTQDRAPSSIEDEMEATRERLAATIDQLAYRASPKTIVKREIATIKAHFVDAQGNPRTDNILKVAGAVVGAVVFVVVVRKVTS